MAAARCQFTWLLLLLARSAAAAAAASLQQLADQEHMSSSCKQALAQPTGVEAEEVVMMQVSLKQESQRRQQPAPNFGMAGGNHSGSHLYVSLLEDSAALWDKFMVVTQVENSAATPASAVLAGEQRRMQHLLAGSSPPKPHFEPLPPLRLEQDSSKQPNHGAEVPARTGVFIQLQPQMLAEQKGMAHQTSQTQSQASLNFLIVFLGCAAGVAVATVYLFARMTDRDQERQLTCASLPNLFATEETIPPEEEAPRRKKGGCC